MSAPLSLEAADAAIAGLGRRMLAVLLSPGVQLGPVPECFWCRNRDKAIAAGFRCRCEDDCGSPFCWGDWR